MCRRPVGPRTIGAPRTSPHTVHGNRESPRRSAADRSAARRGQSQDPRPCWTDPGSRTVPSSRVSRRTEPGHWPWRGQREGGHGESAPAQPIEHRTGPAQVVGADTSGSQQGYYRAGTRPVPFPSPWTAFTGFAQAVAQVLGRLSRQSGDSPLQSDECRRLD